MIDGVISACTNEINYKFNLSHETYLTPRSGYQIVEAVIYRGVGVYMDCLAHW